MNGSQPASVQPGGENAAAAVDLAPTQAGEGLAEIPLETRHFEDLGRYLVEPMIERVRVVQQHAGELLAGRTVWMVNFTAWGGGVAQLLRTLLPYWKGAGIDVRWVVLLGSGEFFRVTKRFHNHLQGQPGDGDVLGIAPTLPRERRPVPRHCHGGPWRRRAGASAASPTPLFIMARRRARILGPAAAIRRRPNHAIHGAVSPHERGRSDHHAHVHELFR
jgi:hypothetical protein